VCRPGWAPGPPRGPRIKEELGGFDDEPEEEPDEDPDSEPE